ncbi:Hypothetical predicted protein, partial [Pelobates cultripes]
MFPETSQALPVTKPHTHPNGIKQVKAWTPRALSCPKGQKQQDTHKRRRTEVPLDSSRNLLTAPGNRQVNRR